MTIAATLAVAIMRLRSQEAAPQVRESARADAQALLCEVLDADLAWVLAHGGDELDADLLDIFGLLLDERMRGVPIAYLTRRTGFYGREFFVDERVLVPRPESEHLVAAALAELGRPHARARLRALDVGTGSGALAITFAAEVPNLEVTATDVSADALQVARRNAREHCVEDRVTLVQCDLVDAIAGERFDCIVANLPYVPSAEIPMPPNPVGFEPPVALDGGSDGLSVYRRLVARLAELAAPDASAIMEAAPPTIASLARLVRETYPSAEVRIGSDYAGLERFIVAKLA